jgi:ferrous iron transport protein B
MGPENPAQKTLLLIGNPNVGKSVIFSRLTGVRAISSNYPGTTVGFLEGWLRYNSEVYRIIDVPGAYTLDPTNEAEQVARRMVDEGADLAIIVLDATALERNLYLAFQAMERGIHTIVALNMVDEARHRGISIDVEKLEKLLGVPVVPTVALSGQGINRIIQRIPEARKGHIPPLTSEERWKRIGLIIEQTQKLTHRHHTLRDKLEDLSVDSFWGGVIGVLVIALSFYVIRLIGEGLINTLLNPITERVWIPALMKFSPILGKHPILHQLLIGTLIHGTVDMEQSFGLLSTGLYVPLVMVLPYVLSFYLSLSFLEDVGYLPRFAVLFDALFHHLGLHGYAIVPALLGLGCNVPGILATRVLESERERFIAATLISIAIPCAGLQAMIVGVIGHLGGKYVIITYGVLFSAWVVIGRILHALLPGHSPELIVEIPPYRIPSVRDLFFKLWFRLKGFIMEAIPLVMGGVLLINLLYMTGVINGITRFFRPVFTGLLGLPAEAAGPIIMGLLRKDVAVGMLSTLNLTPQQLIVATVTLAMTFPCIATFIVLWKELGGKKLAGSLAIMIFSALTAGSLLRIVLNL